MHELSETPDEKGTIRENRIEFEVDEGSKKWEL